MYEDLLTSAYGERNLQLVRGEGTRVWDAAGKPYLDFISGIAVNALGHNFSPVVEAAAAQLRKMTHASNLFLQEPQIQLARMLSERSGMAAVFFSNSGAEANEGAIKFARKYWYRKSQPERLCIVTLENSFHGRTYGALAATGQPALKEGIGPMPEGFQSLSFTDSDGWSSVDFEKTAAILLEPVLAEGGVLEPPPKLLDWVKKAQSRGVVLICDEVQTGLGRTGSLFGYTELGLNPDIITLAKPLGGGLPLGAILISADIAESVHKGDHGSTFGGNPVACAAGAAVMEHLLKPGFLSEVKKNSAYFRDGLQSGVEAMAPSSFTLPLLGRGFLVGLRYAGDLGVLIAACRKEGLLIHRAGNDVVRFLPPLNVSRSELDTALELFFRCARRLGKG